MAVTGYISMYVQMKHQYIIPYMYLINGENIYSIKKVVQLQYKYVYPKG